MIGIKQHEEQNNIGLHNALAAGTILKGDITTETDFRLDGSVEGNIRCKGKIVVGPKGNVLGDVQAENAEILGTIKGNVRVNGRLVLKTSAVIEGDIHTQQLEVEPNAQLNGSCKMERKGMLAITAGA